MSRRSSFIVLTLLGLLCSIGIQPKECPYGGAMPIVARASAGNNPVTSATFIQTDTTTQGNWKGQYGADGYNVINHFVTYPCYAQVTPNGHTAFTWASSTTNVRALEKVTGTDRIAAAWYTTGSYTIDVNLTDGEMHQVALYCLDWGASGHQQRIDILDASDNSVLDSQTLTNFSEGKYLVWDITGHVIIKVTATGTTNFANVSGLFFGGGGSGAAPSAAFIQTDMTTQGNWKGQYGADGYNIINHAVSYPCYAQVIPNGHTALSWASSTTNIRALQKTGSTSFRIAATWYTNGSYTIDLDMKDGLAHKVSLYCLDWTSAGHQQRIDILDASDNSVLDSRTLTDFSNGKYLIWDIKGHVIIKITATGSTGTAVVSGLFFDPPANPPMVNITSPSNGAIFVAPANITIEADASDSDGSISKVEFFQGTTKLGEDTTSPYAFTWSDVATGNYTLAARATDNGGVTTTSSAVNITVNATNPPPTVSITSPVNNASFIAGDDITITANAADIDGTISKVEFFEGTTLLGEDTTSPYSFTWNDVAVGTYSLTAKATDNLGGVTTSIAISITVNFLSNNPVHYVYDELGRLIAAIDSGGDTAIYNYDAVGNLLSISRQSSSIVSILEFTPDGGAQGSTVTIHGTGFSATPGQNTVTFNGTTATVTSSTATKLVTAVPTGATTGAIAVTTPSGSATSSESFTVGAATGAPTISGFTPTIGTPGTAVTISGTGFETVPLNNRVGFNITSSTVSSAAATSITASAPPVGSGRISVTTPYGKAVSSEDFFIPPSPYTATDVDFTGRMATGGTGSLTINTPGEIALMLFDGTKGQRVSLSMYNVTTGNTDVIIYNPNGTPLSSTFLAFTSWGFIDVETLPATGTYMILVDPIYTQAGGMGLALNDVPSDNMGTIVPGGSAVTVTTTTPGQNAILTFGGTAGQQISLYINNVTIPSNKTVYIINPDGTTLASIGVLSSEVQFIDATTLPTSGTYTILLDTAGPYTGSATLTLYDVVDVTSTVSVGGQPVNVTITTPGQNAILTFSGTASQQVTVQITNNTLPGTTTVSLLKADGTALTSSTSSAGSFNLAQQTLPESGTYTVKIDPSWIYTGSISISVTSP